MLPCVLSKTPLLLTMSYSLDIISACSLPLSLYSCRTGFLVLLEVHQLCSLPGTFVLAISSAWRSFLQISYEWLPCHLGSIKIPSLQK